MAESMKPVAWAYDRPAPFGGYTGNLSFERPSPVGNVHIEPLYTAAQLEQARREEAAKRAAELERLRELAATAEKWRGMASARHGDGRTVSEIRREAAEEEREACAQIAAKHEFGAIAAYSIRARNEKGGSW